MGYNFLTHAQSELEPVDAIDSFHNDSGPISVSTDYAHHGTHSLRLEYGSGITYFSDDEGVSAQSFAVIPGRKYDFSIWAKALIDVLPPDYGWINLFVNFFEEDLETQVGPGFIEQSTVNWNDDFHIEDASGFYQPSPILDMEAPVSAAWARPVFGGGIADASMEIYVDSLYFGPALSTIGGGSIQHIPPR